MSIQRRFLSSSVSVAGTDPCTEEWVEVGARLTVLIIPQDETGGIPKAGADDIQRAGAGETTMVVEARLDNPPQADPGAGIESVIRHFAFSLTANDSTPYIQSLRTPLAGQQRNLDLLVNLAGGLDSRGEPRVWISDARIDWQRSPCYGAPSSPPVQPITRLVQLLLNEQAGPVQRLRIPVSGRLVVTRVVALTLRGRQRRRAAPRAASRRSFSWTRGVSTASRFTT